MNLRIKRVITKSRKHRNALIYIWIIILIYLMLSETKILENLANYNGIVTFSTIIICTIIELYKRHKYTRKETVFVLITIVLFFQSVFLTNISIPAEILFYIFILRRTKKEEFIETTMHTMMIVIISIVTLSYLKIIPDVTTIINGRKMRTSLGFVYPSRVQTYLMLIVFLWINMNYKRKKHIYGLLLINGFSTFCFIYSDAKFPYYIGMLVSILSVISRLPIQTKRVRQGELIAYLFTIIAPFTPFVLAILFNPSIRFFAKLDSLLTGRLYYSLLAIKNRPLHIFNFQPGIDQNIVDHYRYGYLDSGYLNLMYNFGLYLYIIYVLLVLVAACNARRNNDTSMLLTLVFTIVYSLWYGQVLTLLQYSIPIILCTYYLPWKQSKGFKIDYSKQYINRNLSMISNKSSSSA